MAKPNQKNTINQSSILDIGHRDKTTLREHLNQLKAIIIVYSALKISL